MAYSRASLLLACLVVAIGACSAVPVGEEVRRYDGHKVLRVVPGADNEVRALKALGDAFAVDWWKGPGIVGRPVDFRVAPEDLTAVNAALRVAGLAPTTLIECVQTLAQAQVAGAGAGDRAGTGLDLTKYNTYEDIVAWVKTLPTQFPHLATLVPITKSYEGREVLAVKVSTSKSVNGTAAASNKPAFWFDGGIHAREWISPATVVYMLDALLTKYGADQSVTQLLDHMDFFVLPVFNPDGYAFTFSNDRMWRKTRSKNKDSLCRGVDPNRNWQYEWGKDGASTHTCSESFEGYQAFSEVEVRSVGEFIKANLAIQGYINFHSYSQLWMSPWGWTSAKAKDFQAQDEVSVKAIEALKAVHNTDFQHGAIATTIYPASGSSADYTYSVGVEYSYGVELRDTGKYGFLLPADQIVASGEETFAAIKAMAQFMLEHPAPRQ